MGFTLPLALALSALVGLPIAAHLVRRRDVPRVSLPTIALLRASTAANRKRVRLDDRGLLALRILGVAIVALAAAAPYYESETPFGDGQRVSVVVIIDDSMSMRRVENGRPLIEEATERAADALRSLPEGSEAAIVLAGHPARLIAARTDNPAEAVRSLLAAELPSSRGTDLPRAVELARSAFSGARHERRLWLLSDFSAHARAEQCRWPQNTEVIFDHLGEDASDANAAIGETHAAPAPSTADNEGDRYRIHTRLLSTSVQSGTLRLHQGETLLAERTVSLGTGATDVHLEALATGNNAELSLELEHGDAIAEDNRRALLLRPPAALRVLLVDGHAGARWNRQETGYLARALDAAPRTNGGILYRRVDPDNLRRRDLQNVDVVVFANVPAPSRRLRSTLEEFVDAGGGLFIALGAKSRSQAYRRSFGALLPASIGVPSPASGDVERSDAEHSPWPSQGLTGVSFSRRFDLQPSAGATVYATLEGVPLLIGHNHGQGQVLLLGANLNAAWSDLPYQPGYVAFALRCLRHLGAQTAAPQTVLEAGSPLPLRQPANGASLWVRGPDGERRQSTGDHYDRTEVAGLYQVENDDGSSQGSFVVVSPASESNLTAGPLPEVPETAAGASTPRGRSRAPVAPWLFVLAALVLLAEGLLRDRPRQAQGSSIRS